MALKPSFFSGAKKLLIVLIIIGLIASLLSYLLLPGNYAIFFGLGLLILTANVGLMLFFTNLNDSKRPNHREEKRGENKFDFRK